MEGIFISYRREESSGHAGRIYDRLRERFGKNRVFMDVSAIEPGVDFVEAIDRAVGSCAVLLVVIGRSWLECTNAAGKRRLDDPKDFIRLEVGTALRRTIRVIPVLVQNAAMPGEDVLPEELKLLARRNAIEINDSHWDSDLSQLVETLERVLAGGTGPAPQTGRAAKKDEGGNKNRLTWMISSITAVVVALAGLFTGIDSFRDAFVRLFKGEPAVTTTTGKPPVGTTPPASSKGPPAPTTVTVPNVIRQPLERAVKILTEAGLQPGTEIPRPVKDIRPGTIVNQKVKPGSQVKRGSTVDLWVAVQPTVDTPPVTPARKVLAKGSLDVRQTFRFDLDAGRLVQSSDADIWFEAVTATERYLTPLNGAAIGLVRGAGDYEKCSQVRMAGRRISIEKLPDNVAVCVRTNRGNLAAFRTLEPVGPSPGVLKISYIVWE